MFSTNLPNAFSRRLASLTSRSWAALASACSASLDGLETLRFTTFNSSGLMTNLGFGDLGISLLGLVLTGSGSFSGTGFVFGLGGTTSLGTSTTFGVGGV